MLTVELLWETRPCLNLRIHSHHKGAKNLSYSSLCPKAAISLLWKSRRCAASNCHSSNILHFMFSDEAESPFLFSFLMKGERKVFWILSLNPNIPIKLDLGQDLPRPCGLFPKPLHLSLCPELAQPRESPSQPLLPPEQGAAHGGAAEGCSACPKRPEGTSAAPAACHQHSSASHAPVSCRSTRCCCSSQTAEKLEVHRPQVLPSSPLPAVLRLWVLVEHFFLKLPFYNH